MGKKRRCFWKRDYDKLDEIEPGDWVYGFGDAFSIAEMEFLRKIGLIIRDARKESSNAR